AVKNQHQTPSSKFKAQSSKDQKPRTRNQGPETKDQKPRTRNQGPETKDQKPRTRPPPPLSADRVRRRCGRTVRKRPLRCCETFRRWQPVLDGRRSRVARDRRRHRNS